MSSSTTIKKNFAYSSILTITGYIFPFITFPYVSRILGPEGIGEYNFANSVISYFSIFAMMGINTIGIREMARAKDNKSEVSRVFNSLLLLNLTATVISIFCLLLFIPIISSFEAHKDFLYIGVANILCSSLIIEWFYKGIEDFKYITIRSLVIRCIYVISIFVFIKDRDDSLLYFLLTTLMTVINAAVNLIHARQYVIFSLKGINFKPFIKSFFILGIYQILTSMYISFNVIYLGSVADDTAVGYYSVSVKLYTLLMSVFTAFTGVMLPRMSSILSQGSMDEFKELTTKSFDCLLLFSLPCIAIAEIYAPEIIRIVGGVGYEGSIMPFRIIMPLMFIVGYEQIVIVQILTPLKKDVAILINSLFGALVSLLLNFLLVSNLRSVGSSIVWFASELAVLVSAQRFVIKYVNYWMPIGKLFRAILSLLPAVFICLVLNKIEFNFYFNLIVGTCIVYVSYTIIQMFIFKNDLIFHFADSICSRFINMKK